jgi:hypothetical protein
MLKNHSMSSARAFSDELLFPDGEVVDKGI